MVKHIVMWKLKEEAEGNSKEVNAKLMKKSLEDLKEKIPVLKLSEVGINNNDVNEYDVVLNCEFNNMADLDIYQNHPEHVKVGGFVRSVVESRACVDYEM